MKALLSLNAIIFLFLLTNPPMSFGGGSYQEEVRKKFKEYNLDMKSCWFKKNNNNSKTNAVACHLSGGLSKCGLTCVTRPVKCGQNKGHIPVDTPLVGLRVVLRIPPPGENKTITLKNPPGGIGYYIQKPNAEIALDSSLGKRIHEEFIKQEGGKKTEGSFFSGFQFPENPYIISGDTPMYSDSVMRSDNKDEKDEKFLKLAEQDNTTGVCFASLNCIIMKDGKQTETDKLGLSITSYCPLEGRICPENPYKCMADNRFKPIGSYVFDNEEKPRIIPAEEIARRLLGEQRKDRTTGSKQ